MTQKSIFLALETLNLHTPKKWAFGARNQIWKTPLSESTANRSQTVSTVDASMGKITRALLKPSSIDFFGFYFWSPTIELILRASRKVARHHVLAKIFKMWQFRNFSFCALKNPKKLRFFDYRVGGGFLYVCELQKPK